MESQIDNLYKDARDFGRFYATLQLIICIIIFITCLYFGNTYINKKCKYTDKIKAKILKDGSKCVSYMDVVSTSTGALPITKYKCELQVEYEIDNKIYKNDIDLESKIDDTQFSTIDLFYNKDDPTDISDVSDDYAILGWGIIAVGIIILIMSLIYYYLSINFKFFAGARGLSGAYSLLSS